MLLHEVPPTSGRARPGERDFPGWDTADLCEMLEASLPHLAAAAETCGRMVEDTRSFLALAASRGDRIASLNAENARHLDRLATGGRGD